MTHLKQRCDSDSVAFELVKTGLSQSPAKDETKPITIRRKKHCDWFTFPPLPLIFDGIISKVERKWNLSDSFDNNLGFSPGNKSSYDSDSDSDYHPVT